MATAPNSQKTALRRRVLYTASAVVALGIVLKLMFTPISQPPLQGAQSPFPAQNGKASAPVTPAFTLEAGQSETDLPCSEPFEKTRVSFFSICTANDSIEYKGIRIKRLYLNQDRTSTAEITRGKRVLARHSEGEDRFGHDSTFFSLFPLLGGVEKQLIIVQFTGGAHCCFHYWIYELYPKFRLLFDGTKYEIGDGFDPIVFQDLDGDDTYEFTQKIITFDYTLDCYTCTPQPTMVFKYNWHQHQYLPANRRFVSYVLRDARDGIHKLKEMMKAPEASRDPTVIEYYSFEVLLSYIYAGKEREAWRLYDEFAGWPGDSKWRREIKKKLKADSLYRFLYRL